LASALPAGTRQYVVQVGDTLRSIARRFGTTVARLRELNRLPEPATLVAGQIILVPAA